MPELPSSQYPIFSVLDELKDALRHNNRAILQADPGAGKTTLVPPSLLDEAWLEGRKIIILAPRRLAARSAAMRMAALMQEDVGQSVGYRVRMDNRTSPKTRIEVITEGILTRRLQNDPELADTGLIIFDEFHERSLDGDLGLALCLDLQDALHPDLRLLVMSATLDTEALSELLGAPPVIRCEGRHYPVETRYLGPHTPLYDPLLLYRTVVSAIRQESGSILVFLPGAGEIRRLCQQLTTADFGQQVIIAPLYGNLSRQAQDKAIQAPPEGRRKIVLATNLAETSLTINGIGVVIDSGLERRLAFDPRSGMSRLVTLPVSRASASQRRGRAGRTGPGICLRLWSKHAHKGLTPVHRPEILSADLCRLVLELALWGVNDPTTLKWLDPPPENRFNSGRSLLHLLGALDSRYRPSTRGHAIAGLPVHPRLAQMALGGKESGCLMAACDLAAILSERDPLSYQPGQNQSDIQLRYDLVQKARKGQQCGTWQAEVDRPLLQRIIRSADDLRRRLGGGGTTACGDTLLAPLLANAYPDRIAMKRPGKSGHFLLAGGSGAALPPTDTLAESDFLVIAELDGQRLNGRIYKALSYSKEVLLRQFADQIQTDNTVYWDEHRQLARGVLRTSYHALLLHEEPLTTIDSEQVLATLITAIRRHGLECLPWSKKLRQWQQRVTFLHRLFGEDHGWPDLSDEQLLAHLETWLAPFLLSLRSLRELASIDLGAALLVQLDYSLQRRLEEFAPSHFTVPSGRRIAIDYSSNPPILAARLQEMFGLTTTPAIAGGRQPLLVHLLSPAGRPLQITQDLAGFWHNSYGDVKREMKGRYPKHSWPDDPFSAQPTARAKAKRK